MEADVIRRAAIVVASMHPDVRLSMLGAMDAVQRSQLQSAINEVTHCGWNQRVHALQALEPNGQKISKPHDAEMSDVTALADHLEPAEFARVLHAAGVKNNDFQLAVIAPAKLRDVRQELDRLKPMPPALREAINAAARVLLREVRERP